MRNDCLLSGSISPRDKTGLIGMLWYPGQVVRVRSRYFSAFGLGCVPEAKKQGAGYGECKPGTCVFVGPAIVGWFIGLQGGNRVLAVRYLFAEILTKLIPGRPLGKQRIPGFSCRKI